jgi:maleylpyruvate isomerase
VRPDDHLTAAVVAHRRLTDLLGEVTDDVARQPSLLPDWTVGHVLTHVARNADSFTRAFEGAARGELWARYPGGDAQREADIQAGAGRAAAELVDDVTTTSEQLEAAWASATPDAWGGFYLGPPGGPNPRLDSIPTRRRREVECHRADLALGYTPSDWPDDYIAEELGRYTDARGELPGAVAELEPWEQAAWVMGRLDVAGVAAPGQWY